MSRENIFLLSYINNQITGNKLPSNGDCFRVLFYNMRVINLNLNYSASLVADECLLFWKKARIPTRYHCDIVRKIKKLYRCRLHIFEIILQSIFSYSKLTMISGPEIPIFKRFKNNWEQINQTNISTWESYIEVKHILQNIANVNANIDNVSMFCIDTLNQNLPREDYKEFLELVVIFLGRIPPKGIHFRCPGAYHLARWMCKGIYCLKIYIFQKQFKMTKAEITPLKMICCFIVKCYIEFWFRSLNAIQAPYNDILFLRTLENYKADNKQVAELAIKKFIKHLWYIGEETACFSLFMTGLIIM